MNEESSVPQSSPSRRANTRELCFPSREEFEDWLKEIQDFSSGILDELRGGAAGEESVERVGRKSLGERGNSEHRLALLKQRLTERLQETTDGGEASPAGESDDGHCVFERFLES